MDIEITTYDTHAAFHLLKSGRATLKDTVEIGPDVTARYEGTLIRKSVGIPEIAAFAIGVGGSVAVNVASNAIWDWLKNLRSTPETITIDRCEVEFEEGAVKRIVSERIERRRGKAA